MAGGVVQFAVTRRVTVLMITVTAMLFGFLSLQKMPVTLLPSLEYPNFTIRTEYENAGPEEIELLISKPVEESLGVVKGISRIYSVSTTGRSDVRLEFNWDADIKKAAYDVRDRIDAVQLPLDAEPPILLRFNPSTDPIMQLGLTLSDPLAGENELKALRTYVDYQLKKKLDPVPGVAAVKVSGGYEKEIQILPDQYKLSQLSLSIDDISTRLRQENINLTGGSIKQGNKLFLVRTVNQFKDLQAIENLIITTQNTAPVRIKDVASVTLGHKERKSINRLNGQEAIEVAIYKEGDSNTVAVAENVKNKLQEIRADLPKGSELKIIEDQSIFIDDAINNVRNSALIGGVLAVLVIYLFLGEGLATFIIALLIPVSVVTSFFLLYRFDVSLNIMSLGGIALAVGLLVDNGIVVLENIAAKLHAGKARMQAVLQGTGEVAGAITASTLTTIAVFLPLVFVQGISGQLFKDQALTVTFTLMVSLVFALILIPMLSSLGGRRDQTSMGQLEPKYTPKSGLGQRLRATRKFFGNFLLDVLFHGVALLMRWIAMGVRWLFWLPRQAIAIFYGALERGYRRLLPWSLSNRLVVLLFALTLFVATVFFLVPRIGVDLIPDLQADKVKVNFRLAEGETIESTDAFMRQVSQSWSQHTDLAFVYGISGQGGKLDVSELSGGENSGEIMLQLKSPLSKARMEQEITEFLNKKPGLSSEIQTGQFFDLATPIEVELSGYDLNLLQKAAEQVSDALRSSQSFINIDDGVEIGNPEIQLYFDQEKIASLGLSVTQVANNVVNKVLGKSETTVHWNDQKVELLVRNQEDQRNSIDDVRALLINPGSSNPIRLDDVADIRITRGPGEITRRDQERVVVVSADVFETDLADAVKEARALLTEAGIHPLVRWNIAGQNEDLEASNQSMVFALSLAIFLVYMVLASQFESLIHPFVILFTIPLAMIGAIWALYISGTNISVVVFIGLIMLTGIVVNNAIVLIDLIKQHLAKNMELMQAITEAAYSRLRPIIMTTLTTVLGLLPMVITFSGQEAGAEIRAPMAITVIGGLLVSTLLTLIVVPVVFSLLTRRHNETGA